MITLVARPSGKFKREQLFIPSLVNIFPVFSSNGSTFVCTWCPVSGLCRLILGLLSILTSTVASIFPGERDQHKPILLNNAAYEHIHDLNQPRESVELSLIKGPKFWLHTKLRLI